MVLDIYTQESRRVRYKFWTSLIIASQLCIDTKHSRRHAQLTLVVCYSDSYLYETEICFVFSLSCQIFYLYFTYFICNILWIKYWERKYSKTCDANATNMEIKRGEQGISIEKQRYHEDTDKTSVFLGYFVMADRIF